MPAILNVRIGSGISQSCLKARGCLYSPALSWHQQRSAIFSHGSLSQDQFSRVLPSNGYSTLAPKPDTQEDKGVSRPKPNTKEDRGVSRLPLISFEPDSSAPTLVSKEDRPSLNAADKFFRQRYAFLYSASELRNHPINPIIPEVVILGRSNVGKSTFINALLARSDAAKVSKKAGHTSTMNAFAVGSPEYINKDVLERGARPPRHGLRLLDTPGYGFRSHADWGSTIVQYLQKRKALRGAVLLYNRPGPAHDADRRVLQALAEANCRTLVVLTKADTLGPDWAAKLGESASSIRDELRELTATQQNGWREGAGWASSVYAVAAGMRSSPTGFGNGGGIPGVRRAIMDMAGYNLQETVQVKPESVVYDGDIVPFDDIKWKA